MSCRVLAGNSASIASDPRSIVGRRSVHAPRNEAPNSRRPGAPLGPQDVIVFIVSGRSRRHNFPMSQGAEDDLLPWVVGGVLLIAMTIAVAAVAGSGDHQTVSGDPQDSAQQVNNSSAGPAAVAAAAVGP